MVVSQNDQEMYKFKIPIPSRFVRAMSIGRNLKKSDRVHEINVMCFLPETTVV